MRTRPDNVSAERTVPLWSKSAAPAKAARLTRSVECAVAVIGSGIAGLSCAYELMQEGYAVAVVDRGDLASGMTARTTAHLAPVCDDGVHALMEQRGEDIARRFQESHAAAIERIESIVLAEDIACQFRRLDGILFPALNMAPDDARQELDKEYEAAKRTGLKVSRGSGLPLAGFEKAKLLRYPDQATFHPLRYLNGLIGVLQARGAKLFAHTVVTRIEERADGVEVATQDGHTIKARYVVVATNAPINDRAELHSKLAPYRTYAMAFTLPRGTLPDALYWDLADPYHYVRLSPGPGNVDHLIVGGADHKSGEGDHGDVSFEAIEAWTRQLVPALGKEVTRWSGQVLETPDYCGLIGRNPGNSNVFVCTGDSGQGMTHGALAGMLIRDLIVRDHSPWQDVYAPDRKPPPGLLHYVSENVSALKGLADHVMPSDDAVPGEVVSADDIAPGRGAIVRHGDEKVAAYRDRKGVLHLRSAACTHLGCTVRWNSTEDCWDCLCHGSHFPPDGAVLNGPATAPLAAVERVRATSKT